MFPYIWNLKDGYPALGIRKNKYSVFSCFACGGGSTMGYKLAGYDVIGCNEIDFKMAKCYKRNHHPKYYFIEPIQDFKNRNDLPEELYDLDILDGSPPCSTFSMSGNREKNWGEKRKFREGQSEQILDTLFFDFIDLTEKLKPKVVVAENVKGLLLGKAKAYVYRIMEAFDKAGYNVSYTLLNASRMGVPQRRERVFFIGIRKDLKSICKKRGLLDTVPNINLNFNERKIPFKEIDDGIIKDYKKVSNCIMTYYDVCKPGNSIASVHSKKTGFNRRKVHPEMVCNTFTPDSFIHHKQKRTLTKNEMCKIGTFPVDFNFGNSAYNNICYIIGMSVPPVMIAQIVTRIKTDLLNKIKEKSK